MTARVHLTTCVWGDWHRELMVRVMLPTLLADGNLPRLVRRLDARYRIATTSDDRAQLEASPICRRLADTLPIEWVTERSNPDVAYHIEWYHEAIAAARAERAFCMMVSPDVAWSDGTLDHAADAIEAGKLAVAMPYLRVVSETCQPEIAERAPAGQPCPIAPGELVRLGIRHLHPLSATMLRDGRHTRPALEAIWRVPGEGLVYRHMVRELFVFDPDRLQPTHLWYAGGGCAIDDVHVVTDSDDMLILSFAPLLKDIPVYICDHPVTPLDLARQSLHPLNDTPLTSAFARHSIRLHYGATTEARWRRRVRASHGFIDQAVMMRECLRIWRAIHEYGGCTIASRLVSVALQATRLARQWRHDGPVTVFVPTDAAIARCAPDAIERLVPGAAAARLVEAMLHHVAPTDDGPRDRGPSTVRTLAGVDRRWEVEADAASIDGAQVIATLDVPPHRVLVIDGWLAPGSTPRGAIARAWLLARARLLSRRLIRMLRPIFTTTLSDSIGQRRPRVSRCDMTLRAPHP